MKGIGLASAFRTLTIVPFPGNESESPATGLYWFVPVGLLLGLVCMGVAMLLSPVMSPLLSGALVVASLVWLTRAFHLDGLADTADGFGGGWTKDRTLEIMKDSHTGAFGVVAVATVLVVKVAACATLCDYGEYVSILFIPVLSRFLVAVQTVANPYARSGGGTAARLVAESRVRHALAAVAEVALLMFLFGIHHSIGNVLAALAAGSLVTFAIAGISRRRIGGITGDVLGATAELSETAIAVMLAVLTPLS